GAAGQPDARARGTAREPRSGRPGTRQTQGAGAQARCRDGQIGMNGLDYAVLGVFALSIGWGIWRGLVREVMSLVGWVIAFLAANLFGGPLAEVLPASIA